MKSKKAQSVMEYIIVIIVVLIISVIVLWLLGAFEYDSCKDLGYEGMSDSKRLTFKECYKTNTTITNGKEITVKEFQIFKRECFNGTNYTDKWGENITTTRCEWVKI